MEENKIGLNDLMKDETQQLDAGAIARQNAEAYKAKKLAEMEANEKAYQEEQAKLQAEAQEEHMRQVYAGEEKPENSQEYFSSLLNNVNNTIDRKRMEKEMIEEYKEEKKEAQEEEAEVEAMMGEENQAIDLLDCYDWDGDEEDDEDEEQINLAEKPKSSLKDTLDAMEDDDDDEDDEDDDDGVEPLNYNRTEWFDALSKAAKEKLKPVNNDKVIDLSQFKIADNTVSIKNALKFTKTDANPNVSNWALFNTYIPIVMEEFKGQELAKLTGGEDMTTYTRNRQIYRLIYDHDQSESKPESFTQWLKEISVRDNDNLYMAIYKACYSGSNYVPYNCTECGHVFVTDDIPIKDMIKFETPEDEKRAMELVNSVLREPVPLKSELVQVSERYVMRFRDPSLYNVFIESAVLNDDFLKANIELVNYMSYISDIYIIDRESSQLIPINLTKYDKDIAKEVNTKIRRYAKILKELSDDEINVIEAKISKLMTEQEIKVKYVLPEQTCPRCGATIAEEATSAQDLVFTRHQLGRMATM